MAFRQVGVLSWTAAIPKTPVSLIPGEWHRLAGVSPGFEGSRRDVFQPSVHDLLNG
jgi:hypothetical protein